MRYTLRIAFLLILFNSLSLSSQITWQRVDQTADGPIKRAFLWDMTVAPDGTTLVIAGNGIYRIVSDGGGGTERYHAERLDSLLIGWFLETWGDEVLLATDQAIYRSTDNGSSWREAWRWDVADFPSHMIVVVGENLVVPSATRDSIAVVGPDGQIIRRDTLPRRIRDLQGTPTGTLYALTTGNPPGLLLRSTDAGRTWDSVPSIWPAGFIGVYSLFVLSDEIIFVNALAGPSLISNDGGVTFDSISTGDIIPARISDVEGRMFGYRLSTPDNLEYLISEDGGETWSSCLPAMRNGTFIGRDGRRVYGGPVVPEISEECGDPFTPVESGFRNVEVWNLIEHDGIFWADMASDFYRSIDGGLTWEPTSRFYAIDTLGNLYNRSDSTGTIIVDGEEEDARYTSLSISSDLGETWRPVFDEPFLSTDERPDIRIRSTLDGVIMIHTWTGPAGEPYEARLLHSIDGGATFAEVENWTDSSRFRPFSVELTAGGKILAVGGRYDANGRYLDFGVNRLDPKTGEETWLGGPDFNFLHVGGSGSIYGWKIDTFYRSDDEGETWEEVHFPEDINFPSFLVEKGDGLLFLRGGGDFTIYLSRDGGATWEVYDPSTPWDIDPAIPHQSPGIPDIPEIFLTDGPIIARLHVDRKDSILGTTDYYHYTTLGISTDRGRTWEHPVGETLDRKDITAIAWSEKYRTLLVGTRDHGLYRAVIVSGVKEGWELPVIMDLR